MSTNERLEVSAWFLAWTIPGLLLPGFFMFLPFGALIFPSVAFLAAALLFKLHRPKGPEVLGALLGIGTWGFAIAFFNRDSNPCSQSGSVSVTLQPGESYACGGVAPEPFLLIGALLAVISVLGAATWMFLLPSRSERGEATAIKEQAN